MSMSVTLAARLDTAAAEPLGTELAAITDGHVQLIGSAVELLGGRCLELLMSFKHLSEQDARRIELVEPSRAMVDDLRVFGLSPDDLCSGETK